MEYKVIKKWMTFEMQDQYLNKPVFFPGSTVRYAIKIQ
jgi:hypothetical protein